MTATVHNITFELTVAHSSALEKRLIEISPHIGFIDGLHGKREPMVDGLPMEVHISVVTLLQTMVERALSSGK